MALYEVTFLTKEETDPGVKSLIEEVGGVITDESSLGRRKLAYPIKKETQAVYTTYVFDTDKVALNEFDRRLRLNTSILRFIIIAKDVVKVNKEVSKTVREAIEAAEKLEDTTVSMAAATATTTEEIAAKEPMAEPVEEKPAKKRAVKKVPADAAEATEEDRLKALDAKLSDILKD